MENQHRKIKGYRELNEQEIKLINKVKELGPIIEEVVDELYDLRDPSFEADQNWLFIGKSHLQQGLMALTRSIAKPYLF